MTISATSPNRLTDIVRVVDNVTGRTIKPLYLDLRQRIETTSSDDRFVQVDGSLTFPGLALRMLSDANGWWAIADVSGIVDPFTEFGEEVILRVPSQRRYFFDILAR